MLPMLRITFAFVLTVHVVQYVDAGNPRGNQRTVYVSEPLLSNDKDFVNSSSQGDIIYVCCDSDGKFKSECSCGSLDYALANLTSNVLINITSNVVLSRLTDKSYLENVSIIGHNNPTVNCKNVGGIHVTFCRNCIIQGITWDGCGADSNPVIELNNSSNITIKNCTFQYSKGQTVVLSEVVGDVNIDHCYFVYNRYYKGHGAAIHYSSNNATNYLHILFTNCDFTYNKGAKSLVYIENRISNHNDNIILHHSKFHDNQGVSVYVMNHNLHLNGEVLFQNNKVENGAGFYISDHSAVVFGENSDVKFIQNSANKRGGAFYITNHSSVVFDHNSIATFHSNSATNGSAIYSETSSNVTFQGNCKVTFSSNSVRKFGAAIFSSDNSHVSFTGSSNITFNNNQQRYDADLFVVSGIIYSVYHSYVTFKENSSTKFSDNMITRPIFSQDNSCVSFKGKSSTVFTNNNFGRAIYSDNNSYISFKENSHTLFNNNYGGAIYSHGNSHISFTENSSTVFICHHAGEGGAIHSDENSNIYFKGNSFTVFANNTAYNDGGGAICLYHYSNIYFKGNSSTVFTNNNAVGGASGGSICSNNNSNIYFKDNSSTKFTNNMAAYGGAIKLFLNSRISFEGIWRSSTVYGNGTTNYHCRVIQNSDDHILCSEEFFVTFRDNNAEINGGAIYSDSMISFNTNSTTEFNNNIATKNGGAIYSRTSYISFEGSSVTMFRNNVAEYGGAVLADDHSDIIFNDISTVAFTNNDATFGETVFSIIYSSSAVSAIGNSTVIFNGVSAKWCNNKCLPYTGQDDDVVTIDNNGIVRCSDQKAFICLSSKCYCKKIKDLFDGIKSNTVINITDNMTLSSVLKLRDLENISIIGHNNPIITCVNKGSVLMLNCTNLIIKGITWIRCGSLDMYTGWPVLYVASYDFPWSPVSIIIEECIFQYSKTSAIYILNPSGVIDVNINHCNFINNNYSNSYFEVATIYCESNSIARSVITINNSNFSYNSGSNGIIYSNSITHFKLNNCNFCNNQGVAIYLHSHTTLNVYGDVLFESNVADSSAGIYVSDYSTVTFDQNSIVNFINNSVDHSGATIFLKSNSNIIFDQNSLVTFINNKATNGTINSVDSCNVEFKVTCEVIFSNNLVTQYGSAIYSFNNSHVIFTGNSNITFNNNVVSSNDIDHQFGGTIFSDTNSNVSFEENSTTKFSDNTANFGAAIFTLNKCNITFKDQSKVMFNNNTAESCGVLTSSLYSRIYFNDNTEVTYHTNIVSCSLSSNDEFCAGAICTFQSTVTFSGHSFTTFINNKGAGSGAIVFSESSVIMNDYSVIIFNNNFAQYLSGGAFVCYNSIVTIEGKSNVTFKSNEASQSGGAIHSYNMCKITSKGNSTLAFINNVARYNGGAILSHQSCEITFEGNSTINFDQNIADNGGTFYFTNSTMIMKDTAMISNYNNLARQYGGVGYFNLTSKLIVEGRAMISFDNNTAEQYAGVLYSSRSDILFKGNSTIMLTHNKATLNGGALYFDNSSFVSFSEFTNTTFHHNRALNGGAFSAHDHSNVTLTGNSSLSFFSNEATQAGGVGYFNSHCHLFVNENAMVTFDNNKALDGGALCINNRTKLVFAENSAAYLYKNLATASDLNITLMDHINMNFTNNNAQYGGAIFLDATAIMVNNSDNNNCINFKDNIARILGNSVYQEVAESCNSSSCLKHKTPGINTGHITTPPSELKFSDPALDVCIDNDNDTQCNSYYVQKIMLGREIVIPACVLDYFNRSVNSTQFLVQSEIHPYYWISGPKQVLISCGTFEGISIIGYESISKPTNFSINITLNTALNPNWKQILVSLIVELSPCHPGFWQYIGSKTCECYNDNDIVFCFGSTSTIKRGYWFGSVNGKPTVTFCPINYCNFTCCETSNGYYHLSPVRDNQCRSHRSGTACGSCTHGYTLSFDSTDCVNVESCTAGQTVLVILLTVIYWIVIVTLVFAMMYYKVGIGYLYSITYYYSIVDILLSQNLQASRGLGLTVNIMSSFSKITPQFLGELCLTTGMSGVDQQFIHYIHPSAVLLILLIISLLARRSRRFSEIISRGIIHVICLLLLLSYTSIASTSLLLMRPLTFHQIDKIYTYLSPGIEYFHGRHLAYGIVALLCTVSIVIGLPLLLTLEPFLNRKFNFTKIKPLLDQFQGCYKDKYRCFAGYYMICRLVIIAIFIADSSNDFVASYTLIIVPGIITLIHVLMKPYNKEILNKFDSVILHLVVFITALRLFDDYESPLVITVVFALMILPLLIFIAITLFLHKDNLKKIVTYFTTKSESANNNYDDVNNDEIPVREFNRTVDNRVRRNVGVTVCGIRQPYAGSNSYRESLLGIMDDIKD